MSSGSGSGIDLQTGFASMPEPRAQVVGQEAAGSQSGTPATGIVLKQLLAASTAIAGAFEQEQVLATLAQHALALSFGDRCRIYQADSLSDQVIMLWPAEAPPDRPGRILESQGSVFARADFPQLDALLADGQARLVKLADASDEWRRPPSTLDDDTSRALLLLPIAVHDEPLGFLEIAFRDPDPGLSSVTLDGLQLLVSHAATALENARLFADTYQRESFSNALGRVSLATSATLHLDTVLNLICQESLTIFAMDGIYIWRRESGRLVGIAAQGYERDAFIGVEIAADDPGLFSARIAASGEAAFFNRIQSRSDIRLALPEPEGILAVLGVPLRHEEEIVGVLALVSTSKPDCFSERDISRALQFGGQAAIAIQNAHLVSELRALNEELDERVAQRTSDLEQERDRVEFLLRITSELAASLDEDRVLRRALELVNEIVHATRGVILLVDQETDTFYFRAVMGWDVRLPPGGLPTDMRRNDGLAGWMLENREAVVIPDLTQDARWIHRPTSENHRSVLGVPLISGDDPIGVLMFYHHRPNAFSQEQLALVEAVALQVANAIGNAQLYFFIQDQAEQIGQLLREEQKEAAKNEAILESIADGLLVADETGRIILANKAISQMLGIDPKELVGRSVNAMLGLYGASGRSWVKTIENWARNSDRVEQFSYLGDELAIENRVMNVRLSPVFNAGDFLGTVSIFRDITKEVEVDRVKSEFVSNVSHELRTPMTSIKGYTDLMLMGAAGDMSDGQRHYLEVIKNNAERLKLLVDDLLDISRIETGKTRLELEPLDLEQLIRDVVDGHLRGRIANERRELSILTEIDEAMPLVPADQEKLTRILTNLVDNAFSYTPDEGQIVIRAEHNGEYVTIAVSDTGIGIAPDNLDKIFDRFYRADHDSVQQVPGTGLGLAIVHSLVAMHGGEMSVSSKPGEGSTFMFQIPLFVRESPTDT